MKAFQFKALKVVPFEALKGRAVQGQDLVRVSPAAPVKQGPGSADRSREAAIGTWTP